MTILRFTHYVTSFAIAAGMTLAAGSLGQAQTAGQDMHNAGRSTKNAAKDAGSGVKKGTSEGYGKTKHSVRRGAHTTKRETAKGYDQTKHGAKKAAHTTKRDTTRGYDNTKEGTEHVTGSRN